MMEQINYFITANKRKLLVILFCNLAMNITIGLVDYPYIDDILRQRQGIANFAAHYARYFSEYASWFFQGNRHLTDMGLTTHVLSACIMSLTAYLVLYILSKDLKLSWLSAIASILIGINPWFLEVLSFRFDSPYICLSVLVSVIPFVFLKHHKVFSFFISTIVSIFLMCNSYQASSGIYIVTLLTIIFYNLLSGHDIKNELFTILIAGVAYSIGMFLYLVEMKFNPQLLERGDSTKISEISDLIPNIIENVRIYALTLKNQSANVWLYLFIFTFIIFTLQVLTFKQTNFFKRSIYFILYVFVGFIFSYGVYLFMATTLADDRPRYIYGFAYFISIMLIVSGSFKENKIRWLQTGIVGLLCYYMLSFGFTYASTLKYQKNTFENQVLMLADDITDLELDNISTVYINKFLKNSVVYDNTKINYPILDDLVPNNESLYWPNFMWFNSVSHLDINFQPKDTSDLGEEYQLVLSKKFYDIFKKDDELFINMK